MRGQAIAQAVGDKKSICRYGDCILPMDEALILCAIDLSGRPYLGYEASISSERVGGFDTEMAKESFYAISYSASLNLHIRQLARQQLQIRALQMYFQQREVCKKGW